MVEKRRAWTNRLQVDIRPSVLGLHQNALVGKITKIVSFVGFVRQALIFARVNCVVESFILVLFYLFTGKKPRVGNVQINVAELSTT